MCFFDPLRALYRNYRVSRAVEECKREIEESIDKVSEDIEELEQESGLYLYKLYVLKNVDKILKLMSAGHSLTDAASLARKTDSLVSQLKNPQDVVCVDAAKCMDAAVVFVEKNRLGSKRMCSLKKRHIASLYKKASDSLARTYLIHTNLNMRKRSLIDMIQTEGIERAYEKFAKASNRFAKTDFEYVSQIAEDIEIGQKSGKEVNDRLNRIEESSEEGFLRDWDIEQELESFLMESPPPLTDGEEYHQSRGPKKVYTPVPFEIQPEIDQKETFRDKRSLEMMVAT